MHSAGHFSTRALGAWIFFALWISGVWILSSMPGDRLGPSPFFEADKVAHMGLFAIGGVALLGALRSVVRAGPVKVAFLAFGTMALIGIADEVHQTWTPGRSGADAGDWMADVLGSAIGIACASLFFYARRSSKPHLPAPGADRAA